jgi:Domain of unknown function (DUF4262)
VGFSTNSSDFSANQELCLCLSERPVGFTASFGYSVDDARRSSMTRSLENFKGLSASDAKVLEDIRTHSWHVTGVFPDQNEARPDWAFSIGLFHSFVHPEIIVFGLKLDVCMNVINEIGQQVKSGKLFNAGEQYGDILSGPYKCAFREVQRKHYRDYLGLALWFYEGDPFPVTQCFWPDKDGRFPWDEGCDGGVRDAQPWLSLP